MRVELRKYKAGELDITLIYGGIVLIAVIACRFVPVLDLFPPCSFRAYFGMSCPTCGTTRALVHFAKGEFAAAFAMNPLTAAAIVFVLPVSFYRLITRMMDTGTIDIVLSAREQRILASGMIVLFLLNWAYLTIFF